MPEELGTTMLTAARACIGARFRLQGRNPATGLDCIGLIVWCAKACGIQLPDESNYLLSETPLRLDAAIERSPVRQIDMRELRAGDILRLFSQNQPLHLAIFGEESLIHADMRLRRVVEHRMDQAWHDRVVAAFRLTR